MRTRKYMHGKKRRASPLRQDEKKIYESVVPAEVQKAILTPGKKVYTQKDKKNWEKESKKLIKQGQKALLPEKKTTHTPKIPLGGVAGMMLIPKSAGKGSNVIDPKTGKNKYTGKTEYTPF